MHICLPPCEWHFDRWFSLWTNVSFNSSRSDRGIILTLHSCRISMRYQRSAFQMQLSSFFFFFPSRNNAEVPLRQTAQFYPLKNYRFTAFPCCSSDGWNSVATSVHCHRDHSGDSGSKFTLRTWKILLKKQEFFFTNCVTTNMTQKRMEQVLHLVSRETYKMTMKWKQHTKVALAIACTFSLWAKKHSYTQKPKVDRHNGKNTPSRLNTIKISFISLFHVTSLDLHVLG